MRIVVAHGADESIEEPKGTARGRRRTDVQQIAAVLRKAGHEVLGVAVDGKPECLRALAQIQADLVFNLVESFGDDDTKEPHVAAYYDLLGLRYTGSGPVGSAWPWTRRSPRRWSASMTWPRPGGPSSGEAGSTLHRTSTFPSSSSRPAKTARSGSASMRSPRTSRS